MCTRPFWPRSRFPMDYYSLPGYQETKDWILNHLPPTLQTIQLGLVLGSGLQGLADGFDADQPRVVLDYKVT